MRAALPAALLLAFLLLPSPAAGHGTNHVTVTIEWDLATGVTLVSAPAGCTVTFGTGSPPDVKAECGSGNCWDVAVDVDMVGLGKVQGASACTLSGGGTSGASCLATVASLGCASSATVSAVGPLVCTASPAGTLVAYKVVCDGHVSLL
jgi:hypothetical protein